MRYLTNEEFEVKYNQYYKLLFCISYDYIHDKSESEDIVQETFLKYYRARKTFKDESYEKNWLIKVTKNLCIDYLRHQKFKEKLVNVEAIDGFNYNDNESGIKDNIKSEVSLLENKYKDVIILFYYNDLSIEEISKILNVTENCVKKRLSRARQKLKELIGEKDDR